MEPIVFFGNEKLATGISRPELVIQKRLEKAGWPIEAVVTGKEIPAHRARLAVLAAYGQILPPAVLDEFPLGVINVHPSLLPIYRGPTPIEQAILDNASKTGVTIMKITSEMDAGPIYKQKSIRLKGTESKAELAGSLQALGAELLVEVLPQVADGSLRPRRQPHVERDASYTRLIKKSDGIIDWHKPAAQIEREIRAFLGWPGSRITLFNKDVIITAAHAVPNNDRGFKPGDEEIVKDTGALMVHTPEGYLCVDRLIPAGKQEMTAAEFLRGIR